MSNQPLFSVIIPTYNRAYILRDAIDSILAQQFPATQIIVVDDGSTDGTASLVAEYGDRIDYIFQNNQGAYAACNAGFRIARGEYIAVLDSDDIWLPGKLAFELRLFEKFPEAGAIASDAESWVESGMVAPSWLRMKGLSISGQEPFFLQVAEGAWVKGSLFATCSLTYRRSCLTALGDPPWNTSFRSHGDWDLEIRLLYHSKILVAPQIFAKVRRFADETRHGRATPGVAPTPQQRRLFMQWRCLVFENALQLTGWSSAIRTKLEQAHNELLLELSARAM